MLRGRSVADSGGESEWLSGEEESILTVSVEDTAEILP